MIDNLNYMKTAIETLEGGTSEMNQLKILKVMKQICELNIERIETELVSRIENKLSKENTDA